MMIRFGIAALLSLTGLLHAEIQESAKIHLNQTTAIGSNWLPAGDYRISLASMVSNQPTLVIENVDTKASIFVPAMRVDSKLGSALHTGATIRQTSGQSSLTSVWFEGHSKGYDVIEDTK